MTTEHAVIKLKLSKPPPSGIENYQYQQRMWTQGQLSSFKVFLRWYNNKDVFPTLEAIQIKIAFYHDENTDMLKLGCTLPNLANIYLHKLTDASFYSSAEAYKDLLETNADVVVCSSFIIFGRKSVVDEIFVGKLTNICKPNTESDASHPYTYSMGQLMPTSLYTRWDLDSGTNTSILRQKKPLALKLRSCYIFN